MKIKSLGKKLATAALAITMALTALPMGAADVKAAAGDYNVNLNKTYQTIQGFGGMNHPLWISDLTSSQINTAFGNADNQLGLNILRIHVDENKNNWSRELSTAKAAIAKGAIVFATPWNPPSYMTEPITKNGKRTKRLKTNYYGEYANYLNEFVSYMKKNGVDLYAISIQNEPDWGYEWTWWEPDEIYNFTKNYAGKINCRVISAESFSYNKNYYNKILNDSAALANVDIIGTHFYGTLESQMEYPLYNQKASNKPLWMTEVYVPNSDQDADVWPGALEVATNINGAMRNGFSTYVWWYIRRSYSPIKENGNISKRGYCMAQYSKFVRPGYKRVDTNAKPENGVYISAYKGDGKAVVVVVNKNNSQINRNIVLSGAPASTTATRYRTSASENLAKTANIAVKNGAFNVNLPAQSVSTFVVDLGSGSTQPSQPSNPGNNGENTGSQDVNTASSMECEAMTLSGKYVGKITTPFSGVVLYANNDTASYNQQFGYDSHDFVLRGCSSNSGTATVELRIDGEKKGTFNLTGTTPKDYVLKNIKHNTGAPKIELVCVNDNGTWDAYIDKFSIATAGSVESNDQSTQPTQPSQPSNPSTTATIQDGWYYLKNTMSGKYLTVEGNKGANNANVCISTGTGVDGQKWYVKNLGNGQITLKSALGEFNLDVAGAKDTDGANMIIYAARTASNQTFTVKNTDKSGVYTIGTMVSKGAKALDVYDHKTADGTNVCQWSFYGNPNQQWQFEKVNSQPTQQTQPTQPTQPSQPSQPSQPTETGLKLDYTINSWGSGYNVSFKITNKGAQVNTWTLKLKKSDITIDAGWNVNVKTSGDYYVITPVSWNSTIGTNGTVEFGIQGSGSIGTTIGYTFQ